jgi:L-2-hydroxycarboxylate dehydrogenase (NAD+)
LEERFGRGRGLCVARAQVRESPSDFQAVIRADAGRKLGQPVAEWAVERAIELADRFGVGVVAIDNAFHYLWGGGYVLEAARRGYIAYTNCTSALAEVVPFGGKHPTIGTNPHSWAFPTTSAVGFPILIDWATSAVAFGRVEQLKREGKPLPPDAAVDRDGNPTTDPAAAVSLLPFGGKTAGHKGYGLGLIDEIAAAYLGGWLPTRRGLKEGPGDKGTACFYFQVIHPQAVSPFATRAEQEGNVAAVLKDICSHGNESITLPGEPEHRAAEESRRLGGLLFTPAEIDELDKLLAADGVPGVREAARPIADS